MTENNHQTWKKDWLWMTVMSAIIVLFCYKILFTDQIIRASDVITQYFWAAKGSHEQSLVDYLSNLNSIFVASWEPLNDGGRTLEGGWNAIGFLFHRYLIQHFLPFPASIAWLAVLSLVWGGIGTFRYCRSIGTGQAGAFLGGLIFALCTENLSLINAGHIQKLEAICWFPWVFLFLERALQSGKLFHYAMTALMLAIQFFHMHWQISFYSCLATGIYWFWHMGWRAGYSHDFSRRTMAKELGMAIVMVALFFSTIAMSFAPLVSWSQQSERGEAVGGQTGSGKAHAAEKGIGFDEGMSWSMPPEEIITFLIPGLFGYSRQEAGDKPEDGQVYYWGRMRFTQTGDYLGLLPWFLIPLPLLFRQDRYTYFLVFLMGITLIMALGKYTPVYRFMFEYLPGFGKFRVPKMILFLFAFGAAALSARAVDIIREGSEETHKLFKWLCYCAGITALTALTALLIYNSGNFFISTLQEYIMAPTRYQQGPQLALERLTNMVREALLAFSVALAYLLTFYAWFKKWLSTRLLFPLLMVLALSELWRVNSQYLVVTAAPEARRDLARNDIVEFLSPRIGMYRMQPLNGENAHYYADQGLPNISAYVTISERRYRQYLDNLTLMGPMPDMMNLKYLLMSRSDYEAQKQQLGSKYVHVFTSSNSSVVLENRAVLPKARLVYSVHVVSDPQKRLEILSSANDFKPESMALVESEPPLRMKSSGISSTSSAGKVSITKYQPNLIIAEAEAETNGLLIIGEKYYRWWQAHVDGKRTEIVPVNHILRGVYLTPGKHTVEFRFDPLPFKIGKYLTLASFALFAVMLWREWSCRKELRFGKK